MAFTKRQKRVLSKLFNDGEYDWRPKSLAEEPRMLWNDKAEELVEYGFLWMDRDYADDEIDEWLDSEVRRRIPSHIYWDCSGCLFTSYIDWHRNPNGTVSFVNRMMYDI